MNTASHAGCAVLGPLAGVQYAECFSRISYTLFGHPRLRLLQVRRHCAPARLLQVPLCLLDQSEYGGVQATKSTARLRSQAVFHEPCIQHLDQDKGHTESQHRLYLDPKTARLGPARSMVKLQISAASGTD
jgi:hypothetical protein